MSRNLPTTSHVLSMIRARRSIILSILIFSAIITVLVLRDPQHLPAQSSTARLPNDHPPPVHGPPVLPASSSTHPIHQLIAHHESQFGTLRARQSKSLSEAVAEYRRRYKLPPPPNFDQWYKFAKKRGVELIDEFDTIHHQLLPFWALDPAVIRERVREAIGFDNAFISVMIRDGKVVKSEGGGQMYQWHREATPVMLHNFIKYLPDMDLAFNIHDEPRVILQHDDLSRHVHVATTQNMPKAYDNASPNNRWSPRPQDLGEGIRIKEYKTTRFNKFAHQPTWSNSRLSCPPDSPARSCLADSCPDNQAAYTNLPLGFIQNTTAFSDICNSPSMEKSFGFFDRPNAFDVTHDLFPVFSQSKISSFQDILYPSPWYYMSRVKYEPERDMPWQDKVPTMYWRGSTTGGFSRDGGWRRQHRQIFLSKIQPTNPAKILKLDNSTTPNPAGPNMWREESIPGDQLSHYFDVKFTSIGQCDPGDCDAQRAYFGTVESVNMFDAFRSRFLLDIDGNAFSGRYYAWLLSKSLVLKLAVFREWHDEWLTPWVHYAPLSLKGDEYVESMRYFDQEAAGRIEAQRIADQGKDWAGKVLRKDDLEVWYFRLLLE